MTEQTKEKVGDIIECYFEEDFGRKHYFLRGLIYPENSKLYVLFPAWMNINDSYITKLSDVPKRRKTICNIFKFQ